MNRKRNKPYFSSRRAPASASKRRRPLPPHAEDPEEAELDKPTFKPPPPPALVVMGLPPDSSVLDLKSRFEIYGPISRIRIDRDAVGHVAFRTADAAQAAVDAALDPSFGITLHSKKLQVLWATDPLAQWRKGVAVDDANRDSSNETTSSSKLLRAGMPLRSHGRGNKLASAIVNPRGAPESSESSVLEVPSRAREIVAYDDIL
ncbi:uncharacterized protein At1g27050 [Rosa rugosa]|uniref:uncharacterized protein At1g27050 n=1 Tax=Rosa rugosa TaxID=74645 RepID=UPI002B4082B5|nr:uncharacterized protein At1g27050 [Rosa rugosa]